MPTTTCSISSLRLEVAQAAHHELGFGHLHQAAADIVVGALDGLFDLRDGDVVGEQPVGIDLDLVLLDVAADAGDLGDPVDRGQLVAQVPVLDRAQLLQVVVVALQHVFIDPADPGGIGAEAGRHPLGQLAGGIVEVFENPRTGPVEIGAVFENDIDEGEPKKE